MERIHPFNTEQKGVVDTAEAEGNEREWKVEVELHVDVLEACAWLQHERFTLSKMESSKKLTSTDSNILATVEFHLGTTGMATDMRC